MAPFTPKQSVPRTAEHMQELMGDVSLQVARHSMTLIPPMPPGTVLLDNACGNGVVTQAVIETQKLGNVTIHATDIGPTMCKATSAMAASKGWGEHVKSDVMPAEALIFEDDTFSYSFTNFLIVSVPDPDMVASNIYRTLKPGGVAIVTTWAEVAHEEAILAGHAATRSPDAKHGIQSREVWKKASHLIKVLEKAGFVDVKNVQSDSTLVVRDMKRWATLAWSFLGPSTDGWKQADEDNFDEAVAVVYNALQKSEEFTSDGAGGAKVRVVANIAIARK